jgi:hypothetical protein
MSFIRGKIEADREIVQKSITVGESPIHQCRCGCEKWFDKKTGKEVKVITKTMGDLFDGILPLCQRSKISPSTTTSGDENG